jgi:hypothetical protein
MSIGRLRGQSPHDGNTRKNRVASKPGAKSSVHRREIVRILGPILVDLDT